MKGYIVCFLLVVSVMFSCGTNATNDVKIAESNDKKVKALLFDNNAIKSKLAEIFEIDSPDTGKVFKILISRRNSFTRVTIFQIYYKSELTDLPMGFISYDKNVLLYYTGSEMIFNDHKTKEEVEKAIFDVGIKLNSSDSFIKDSRVFQFDKFADGKIKINFPAISPLDEDDKTIPFKK